MKNKVFVVDGNTMDNGGRDSILSGDELICNYLPRNEWRGCLAVVFIRNKGIHLADITTGNECITLSFRNPLYQALNVPTRDVIGIYKVERRERYVNVIANELFRLQQKRAFTKNLKKLERIDIVWQRVIKIFKHQHPISI